MIATILSKSDEKRQQRFERNDDGILAFKNWVISDNCDVVACESTSDFWVPIYDLLIHHLPVIVGNARDMKVFTHKKTDKVDSEFIAQLALNNMIKVHVHRPPVVTLNATPEEFHISVGLR